MKKWIFIISLIIIIATALSLCNQKTVQYPLMQKESAITQIDIVEISGYRTVSTGNFDSIRVIKNIDPSENSVFLTSFYNLPCKKSFGPSQECLEGLAVRFFFQDGAFQLVGAETSFYCSADNNWSYIAYYFDYDAFHQYLLQHKGQEDK